LSNSIDIPVGGSNLVEDAIWVVPPIEHGLEPCDVLAAGGLPRVHLEARDPSPGIRINSFAVSNSSSTAEDPTPKRPLRTRKVCVVAIMILIMATLPLL
jgi:hypothetical protein